MIKKRNKTRLKPLDARAILQYWESNAKRYGSSHKASWADLPMIEMETRQIARYLEEGDHVLDAGCGNGFSTALILSQKKVHIRGVDLSREMIKNARKRKIAEFSVGDIRSLSEPDARYDKVVAVRVFINLVKDSDRLKALKECARVLKRGGRLLLSDAVLENWQRLNQFRKEWELPEIPMPVFNRYLQEKEFIRMAKTQFHLVETVNFSSTYFVGTRILKPIFQKTLKNEKNAAQALMHWNQWFSQLPSWGDYGTQKLFVFEKV